ncbi:VIT1/CCC1 transporter family protein [Streptomyces cinereoruber]|uniref:hypothetical protein n=1 Tax=Streptomyces cinereoruber TaxID=67260 RepID=UPI0036295D56
MTATETIAMHTTLALGKAATARQRLTEGLANRSVHLTTLMEAVLTAEAEAAPWERLAKRIERHGVREGLARQREEALEVLLQYGGPGVSTSLVVNAARNAEYDGLRRFLTHTEGLEVQDEPTPEPAPATPEATELEEHGLRIIRDTFVDRIGHKGRDGWRYSTSVQGVTLDTSLGDLLVGRGWAEVGESRPLADGQRVTLTVTGRHILAG